MTPLFPDTARLVGRFHVPQRERPHSTISPLPHCRPSTRLWLNGHRAPPLGRAESGAPSAHSPTPRRRRLDDRTMDGATMHVGGDASVSREQFFDDLLHRAITDLYVAVRRGSPEATAAFQDAKSQMPQEWEEEKPGEMNSHVEQVVEETAVQIVDKVAADTLTQNYAKELEELRSVGDLSNADAEYQSMAYNDGLSTAAERSGNDGVSPCGYAPVDEEAESAAEKQFWSHRFHEKRNNPASMRSDQLGSGVHDAVVGMAALRRNGPWGCSKDQWYELKIVLKSVGGGIFSKEKFNGMVESPNGPTVLLRRDATQTLVEPVAATKTMIECLRDCELRLVSRPEVLCLPYNVRVHAGWATMAARLVPDGLFAKIDAQRLPKQPLRVVWAGHSLGGARRFWPRRPPIRPQTGQGTWRWWRLAAPPEMSLPLRSAPPPTFAPCWSPLARPAWVTRPPRRWSRRCPPSPAL